MEDSSLERFRVLYIGGDISIISEFESHEDLFDIVIAEHGLGAVNLIKEYHDFDTIISEDNLPGMNGIGIFRMISAKYNLPETSYIIISHEKNPELVKEAIKEKIDDVYIIPVKIEDVYIRIKFLKSFKKQFAGQKDSVKKLREYRVPLVKRVFDILVSGFALLLLSPLFLLIAIAVKLESSGAVFYTSKRVGTGYKIFDFYKFRSMYTGADAKLKELEHLNKYAAQEVKEVEGKSVVEKCPRCLELPDDQYCSPTLYSGGEKLCEYWYQEKRKESLQSTFKKLTDDPRITRIGKVIRNSSIDELPQLFNVLKGDMSIVGNRPLPLYEAEMLTSDDWSQRFLGPAGITGLWQVELRGKKGNMSEEERKALDNEYAKSYSFIGDIKLILRTIPALLQKDSV